jgi:hypothetical protein
MADQEPETLGEAVLRALARDGLTLSADARKQLMARLLPADPESESLRFLAHRRLVELRSQNQSSETIEEQLEPLNLAAYSSHLLALGLRRQLLFRGSAIEMDSADLPVVTRPPLEVALRGVCPLWPFC